MYLDYLDYKNTALGILITEKQVKQNMVSFRQNAVQLIRFIQK